MARSTAQPEMINRAAYRELQDAGMDASQAEVVAAHLPDWSRFATKEDLAQLESRLIRWMVGIFVGSVTVVGGLLTVLVTVVN